MKKPELITVDGVNIKLEKLREINGRIRGLTDLLLKKRTELIEQAKVLDEINTGPPLE